MSGTQQAKQLALNEILSKYKVGREQIDAVSGLPLADKIAYTNQQQRGPAGKKLLPTNTGEATVNSSLNWDYKNGKQGFFDPETQPTAATTPEAGISATGTPAGIDPNLYATYKSTGLTDDQIGRIHGATPETPFSDIFKKTEVAPEPINEARVNASRNVANLGEGIKVLGDMFAVGQGARVSKRNAGDIVQAQATKEDTERNKYLAKLESFKAGERQSAEKDWMLAFQDREKKASEVRSDLKEMRAREAADKKYEQQLALKAKEDEREEYWKNKNYGLQKQSLAMREANATHKVATTKPKSMRGKTEILLDGKTMWVSDAIIKDIAGRARNSEQKASDEKSKYDGMSDEEVFNKEKSAYLKYIGGGNIGITNKPNNWNTGKVNKESDPLKIL